MYGAKAIAANLFLQGPARSRDLPKEYYVPKYPAPHPQSPSAVVNQQVHQTAQFGNVTWAVVAAAFIGLIATFAMHLINLRMQSLGIAGSLIGMSVAIQAFAICVSALVAKQIV